MELVSFISHAFSKEVLERYNIIKNSLVRGQKLVFITTSKDIIDQLVSNDIKYEYLDISHEEIHENCFQINSTNCNPSLNNVFLQIYAKNTNFDYYWFVEYDVTFYNKENNNNSFKPLFNYFKNKKYDLICDHYRQLTANAEYIYRYSYFINSIKTFLDINKLYIGFLAICRFSKSLLEKYEQENKESTLLSKLFTEISLPTIAQENNFSICSLDENNLFSLSERMHPFIRRSVIDTDRLVNIGSNSWKEKPYNPTNDYLMYHNDIILHPVKSKKINIDNYNDYKNKTLNCKIWVCGNNFKLWKQADPSIYNKFDLSDYYNCYNINDYNRIFSEFVMMHYVYANNLYSKYIGTAHYSRYPVASRIDYSRLDNGEIQFFSGWNKSLNDNYVNDDFALIEKQVKEFDGPDMLIYDMIEYLKSNKVVNVDDIINYTKKQNLIIFYRCEIFTMKWELFCEMMEFVEGYIRFISAKYNIYSMYQWIEHIKTNVIEYYRIEKTRNFCTRCYQNEEKFNTINDMYYGYTTSNCWRVYSYMIEMLISIFIGTHKNFAIYHSFYSIKPEDQYEPLYYNPATMGG